MDRPTNFGRLSSEMHVEIIKLLEKAKDRVAASGVCRYWRSLTADPKAWKGARTLIIEIGVPLEDACRLVKKFSPGLKSVKYRVQRNKEARNFIQSLIDEGIRLRKLELGLRSELPPVAVDTKLLEYAASNGDLESMVIEINRQKLPRNFGYISTSVKELVLILSYRNNITWSNLLEIMKSFPNLDLLYLKQRHWWETATLAGPFPGREELKETSKVLSNLKAIALYPKDSVDDSALATILASCLDLQVLILDSINWNFRITPDVISGMAKLVFLSLKSAHLPSVFKDERADSFKFLKRLQLENDCDLDQNMVKNIASQCSNVSWLTVKAGMERDDVVITILESFKKLRILSLPNKGRSRTGGSSWLARLSTTAPELELLQLLGRPIIGPDWGVPQELVNQAARDRPGLFIADDHHFYRAVRVEGGEPRMESFPVNRTSRLLLYGGYSAPSLRAIREDQVVPLDVGEYITRPSVPEFSVRVDCGDLESYFLRRNW